MPYLRQHQEPVGRMTALAKPMYMRYQRKAQHPDSGVGICAWTVYNMTATYLQRHEQALTLNVGETEVDASGITVNVTVANNVLDA